MDRLTSMDAFVRVVDAGSFAEAARRWGRSTSAVSKYVAQLEAHLGVQLLQRTTRQCRLTDQGAVFAERCRQVLLEVDEAESQLRAVHRDLSGPLRITAPPGFLVRYRREAVTSFVEAYPGVRLDIDLTHRLLDLVEERIDVAIRLTDPDDSSLIARRLGPAPLVLVASPAFLARIDGPTHPSELAGLPCIADTNFRFHPRWPLLADGERVDVAVNVALCTNSPILVVGLARDGLGIALVPRLLAEDELASGALVEVLPGAVGVAWSVWAVTSQRRHHSAPTRAYLEHLRAAFAAG